MGAATIRCQRRAAELPDGNDVPPTWGLERAAATAEAAWRNWPEFTVSLERAIDAGGAVLLRLDLLDLSDLERTYGAQTTAIMLAATELRLTSVVPPNGAVIGDGRARFAVFLAGSHDGPEAAGAAQRLCAAAMAPIAVLGCTLHPAAAVGAAQSEPGCTVATLRSWAECALEEARRGGAGAQRLFTADLQNDICARTLLRQALQQAIAERQFRLHYQPVVRLADRRLVLAEALLRWEHPELGRQSPVRFIPAAEATGLIVPLGLQVLDMALAQLARWRAVGAGAPRVAVNVSGVQLRCADFAEAVCRALHQTGVPPAALELELTEGTLIEQTPQTLAALAELAGLGVTLAVDDFGTGYASLRYLRDLPVRKLKIDRTFVSNLAIDSRDASIVAAVVAMARGLGLTTTAEGVQTEDQYRRLCEIGCDEGQGWLFGAPVRPEVFA